MSYIRFEDIWILAANQASGGVDISDLNAAWTIRARSFRPLCVAITRVEEGYREVHPNQTALPTLDRIIFTDIRVPIVT